MKVNLRLSNWIQSFAVVMTLFFSSHANALILGALSDANSSFGPVTVTRDSVTGLEWLDLNQTTAFSFNSVSAEFGSGGAFAGFAMATPGQVDTMLNDSGILTVPNGALAQAAFDTYGTLFDGQVDDLGGFGCVLTYSGMVNDSGMPGFAGVGIDRTPLGAGGCGPIVHGSEFIEVESVPRGLPIGLNDTISDHNSSSPITIGGIFLVRSFAVDTPPTIQILFLGLTLLVGVRTYLIR